MYIEALRYQVRRRQISGLLRTPTDFTRGARGGFLSRDKMFNHLQSFGNTLDLLD